MGGEELEGSRVEEVAPLRGAYAIDRIDEHLATPGPHEVGMDWVQHEIEMDLYCDRYFCRPCDVWIDPPCDCKLGDDCPFPDQPAKPSLSTKGMKDKIGPKTLEGMRKRRDRLQAEKDGCVKCKGERGGVPGNENIVDGRVLCDYCTAEEIP